MENVPEQWRGVAHLFILPIFWLYPFERYLWKIIWYANNPIVQIVQRVFLLLPYVCIVVGLWCTMLSLYTLLFRAGRHQLLGTLVILWWDAARAIWSFWAGTFKFLIVIIGSIFGVLR